MLKYKITFAVLTASLFLFCPDGAGSQKKSEWDVIASSGKYAYMYNPKKVTHTSKGTLKVWIKQIPSFDAFVNGEAKQDQIKARRKSGLSTDGYEKWSHTLTLFEFNCSERKSRTLSSADYDDDGEVLASEKSVSQWGDVVPDSIGESMLEVVCKRRK